MDWLRLLTARRYDESGSSSAPATRSDYERDYHRILFSYPFRRLQGKTQVFPLPTNDHIHNRLTHSLEVAAVGRSLAKTVGRVVIERHAELAENGLYHGDFGDVVAAACLAHDLGNPPFGHAGEDALSRWFRRDENQRWLGALSQQQQQDLKRFEGNAQGLRIATRLSTYTQEGGMRLTAATLGTFAKYPQSSLHAGRSEHIARKKFNFFASEEVIFRSVAEAVGLIPWGDGAAWHRHPLAYLVEAADDICYIVMDAEDGYLTERFSFSEVCDLLEPLAKLSRHDCTGSHDERVNRLRARAISRLVVQVAEVFLAVEPQLLAGTVDRPLLERVDDAPALSQIEELSVQRCYNDHDVIQVLLAGYRVIGELLDIVVPVILETETGRYARHIMDFLPVEVAQASGPYERLLTITDFISGMTDDYAITTFRRLTGIELPGTRDVAAKR